MPERGNNVANLKWPKGTPRFIIKGYSTDVGGALKRGLSWELTPEEYTHLKTTGACDYCGALADDIGYLGLDRVDNTKGYIQGNVVRCCHVCNRAKGELPVGAFIAWARIVVEHTQEVEAEQLTAAEVALSYRQTIITSRQGSGTPIRFLDNGTLVQTDSLSTWCTEHDVHQGSLYMLCHGKGSQVAAGRFTTTPEMVQWNDEARDAARQLRGLERRRK